MGVSQRKATSKEFARLVDAKLLKKSFESAAVYLAAEPAKLQLLMCVPQPKLDGAGSSSKRPKHDAAEAILVGPEFQCHCDCHSNSD